MRLEGYSSLIDPMSEGTAHPEHRNCIQKTTQSRGCATIACKKRASGLKKEGESYTKLGDFLGIKSGFEGLK